MQVREVRQALGLAQAPAALDDEEPRFALDLYELTIPPGDSLLRAPVEADVPLLEDWRRNYLVETFDAAPDETAETARAQGGGLLASGRLRVLEECGVPVSMTAFNAVLPDIVQIGNVYTPPGLRCLGHARRAVALHLAEARGTGVKCAVLFASGEAGSRAYRAIGFRRNGSYLFLFFKRPHVVVAVQ